MRMNLGSGTTEERDKDVPANGKGCWNRTFLRCVSTFLIALTASTRLIAATVCPSGPGVQGMDVSQYNGTIDWNQVRSSGIAFAFIRVSDGIRSIDPSFDTNYASAKAAGIIRGAVQFFSPDDDASAQANLLLARIGTLGPGDLPPALDVEVLDGITPTVVAAGIKTWVTTIQQATGRTPIIYTGSSLWSLIGQPNFSAETLWIASWGVSCPNIPTVWSSWSFWQYSDSGFVPGVGSGGVDLDRFNGSTADLGVLAGVVDLKVDIEIKPGGADVPVINIDSQGGIPVAILSTSSLDAPADIDIASLTFGRTGDEKSLAFCGVEDVNGDGLPDLICHFNTALSNFQLGDTSGILKGETVMKNRIRGTEPILTMQ